MQHEDGSLELLEFSFIPVPANPYALSMRQMKELKLNMPQLVMKGIQFEAKAEAAGDPCTMPDGTTGVLAADDDDPGQLVCVPAEKAAPAADVPVEPVPDETQSTADDTKDPTENEKAIINEIVKGLNGQRELSDDDLKALLIKSGRAISAANKEKLNAVIKSVEDLHAAHGKSSNDVIAALKDLIGPDGGSEGEEKPSKTVSPKPKVEVRDIVPANDSFEAFMATRKVLRTVDAVVRDALKDLNSKSRERYPARR
jgi:hypothetical protein